MHEQSRMYNGCSAALRLPPGERGVGHCVISRVTFGANSEKGERRFPFAEQVSSTSSK
jgi:hypothetical protein